MVKTSRITNAKRQTIRRLKRGKTSGIPKRRFFTKENRFHWLMGIFFLLYISFILYLDFSNMVFRVNWPAGRTYVARVDFRCDDIEATEAEANKRARMVPPVYVRNNSWNVQVLRSLDLFITTIREDTEDFDNTRGEWAAMYRGEFPLEFVRFLRDGENAYKAFRERATRIVLSCARYGVVAKEDLETLDYDHVIISPRGPEQKTPAVSLMTPEEVITRLDRGLKEEYSDRIVNPFLQVVSNSVLPSLEYSETLTNSYRDEVRDQVRPRKKEVEKGTVIINEGEIITKAVAVELEEEERAYKRSLKMLDKARMLTGNMLFTAVFVTLLAFYIFQFERTRSISDSKMFLYFLLIMAFLVIAKILAFFGIPANAVPVVFVGMVTAIVINLRFGIVMVFVLALVTGNIFKVEIYYSIALFASGAVGVFYCGHIRRRVQILKAGMVAGILNAAIIYGVSFARNLNMETVLPVGLAGFISGFLSSVVLIGILPLIEYLFDTTTDVRLLELSDQGHPLLRNLFLQASGTYTHSLGVGNLAESAAGTIGANALLARVASYYHDIGKIFKPEYFIENQTIGVNRHDHLRPGLSSLIISSHTRDGVDLGKEYHLPHRITDIIAEHHGDSKIAFFLQKAQSMAIEGERIDEHYFRYGGPRPRSKESGIVMLADSIEAASRTVTNPTQVSLRKVVERVIRNKLDDGQLDDTQLTMVELSRIKESFVQVLYGIFHARIEYPEENV